MTKYKTDDTAYVQYLIDNGLPLPPRWYGVKEPLIISRPLLLADNPQVENDKLRVIVQEQASLIDSLKWANALKDELVTEAAAEIASLKKEVRQLRIRLEMLI